MKVDVQFVVDSDGKRTGVFMPIEIYEAIMGRLEDEDIARAARESKDEETIPWEQVRAELIAEGALEA